MEVGTNWILDIGCWILGYVSLEDDLTWIHP